MRKVENLRDLESADFKTVLEEGLEMYENEMSIISENVFSNLPKEIMSLSEKAQYMMYNYLTPEILNDIALRETRGDILLSYIMTFDNWRKISELLFEQYEVSNGDGTIGLRAKKRDPILYTKWAMKATAFWNTNNLDKHLDSFEQVLLGGVNKEKKLKDAIWYDAMTAEDKSYRMANRREYTKISGMQNQNSQLVFNVYKRGGGEEKAKVIKDKLGIDRYDISDVIDDE